MLVRSHINCGENCAARYNCHAIAAGRNLSSINDEPVLADLARPARAAIAAAHGRACFTAISARQGAGRCVVDRARRPPAQRPDPSRRLLGAGLPRVTLAVTPLRRIARYGNLFDVAKVAHEISHRWYLIIGGTAWLGLASLAATSTDGMVRRLGGLRWRRLHRIVYGIALLALLHYFQQTKADVTVPIFAASLFLWLIAYRLIAWWQDSSELSTLTLLGLSIAVSVLTFIGE